MMAQQAMESMERRRGGVGKTTEETCRTGNVVGAGKPATQEATSYRIGCCGSAAAAVAHEIITGVHKFRIGPQGEGAGMGVGEMTGGGSLW